MATHWGNEGTVKIGANAVAEIDNFRVSEEAATVDDTSMGDAWETHIVGRKSWSGNLTCHWDETDSTGQEALVVGASVTLNLYPEGASTGDRYCSGTATITSVEVSVPKDGVISRTFNFKGNGALAWAAAA